MTKHDDRKRRIRARMAKTGESYTTARARLELAATHEPPTALNPRRGERSGTSDALATALADAKQLAVEGGAEQVTPMHLCAGLARAHGSVAQQALEAVAITADDCERRLVVALAPAVDPPSELRLSVTARTALEFAREELAIGTHDAEIPGLSLGGGLVQVVRDGRLVWIARPPLRTGHLLLGLLREGSVTSLLPAMDTAELRQRVQALLATDAELPVQWSSQSRFATLPGGVRALLADLDATELERPPTTGRSVYRALASLLDTLPAHRQAQGPLAIWYLAMREVRQQVDEMRTRELNTLSRDRVESMLAAAVDDSPTVIRARRWHASQGGRPSES